MASASDLVDEGRAAYARGSWAHALEALAAAGDREGLAGEDLELLATASYMLGREEGYFAALERSHQAHLDAGEGLRAARCAIWIGLNLARDGEMGQASGWLARAQRLVEQEADGSVERDTFCYRVRSSARRPAIGRERSPSSPRRRRSASASPTSTWWRSPGTSRVTSSSSTAGRSRALACSMRRCWPLRPTSSRPSSPASCTAESSSPARRPTSHGGHRSGPGR